MSKHICDCGKTYSDLNGLEACQIGNHGQPRQTTQDPMKPAIVWEEPLREVGDEDPEGDGGPWAKLLGCITIAGVPHHIEAWAVKEQEGEQTAVDPFTSYEEITNTMTEGAGVTVKINGRDYFMVVTPYQL